MVLRTFVGAFLLSLAAAANSASSVSGKVFDDQGDPFAEAPIQLIDNATGVARKIRSGDDGGYLFADVAAGVYTLSISLPCCALENFLEENLNVGNDDLEFDVRLVQGGSLNTFGDDPVTIADYIRARQQIPDLPPPRRADGKPDLSGVWLIGSDPFPVAPEPTDWAAEVSAARMATGGRDGPHNRCLPQGMPIPSGSSPFMAKFVQTDDLLLILFEDVPGFRQVFLDGRRHPEDPNPSWLGHSIGRWEGDTLVIDTVGFNDRVWLEFFPVTEALHMIERYRRTEYGIMELTVTYEDPSVFKEPWVRNQPFDLAPQEELIEYVCENNKWAREAASAEPD